jgi:hypothetical protein
MNNGTASAAKRAERQLKISWSRADWMRKYKTVPRRLTDRGIAFGKKRKLICNEAGSCSLY